MNSESTVSPKKKFLILMVLATAIILVAFAVNQEGKVSPQPVLQTERAPEEPKPLSNVDEVALQRQLQDILAKGKEADCATLGDARYQFACHDFFKIMNKK